MNDEWSLNYKDVIYKSYNMQVAHNKSYDRTNILVSLRKKSLCENDYFKAILFKYAELLSEC